MKNTNTVQKKILTIKINIYFYCLYFSFLASRGDNGLYNIIFVHDSKLYFYIDLDLFVQLIILLFLRLAVKVNHMVWYGIKIW